MRHRNGSKLTSPNRKLLSLGENLSLIAVGIGAVMATVFNKALFFSIPTFSFALFSHLNRRQLEKLVEQYYSALETPISSIERQLAQVKSIPSEQANLADRFIQLEDKLVQLELTSQNYLTKTQLNRISWRIQQLKKQIDTLDKEDELKVWLRSRDIIVNQSRNAASIKKQFNSVAKFLGSNYSKLSSLYQEIKKCLLADQELNFDLSAVNNRDIAYFTGLCNQLEQHDFLASYQYNKATKIIQANIVQKGEIVNFLNGGWFEIFVYQQVSNFFKNRNIKFQCLINPTIQFANGDNFELDLLFMVDRNPLWLECKTGNNYDRELPKYSRHRELLSLAKKNALIVGLNLSDLETEEKTSQGDLTFANERNLIYKIEQLILS